MLHNRIKNLRKTLKLTQQEFADRLGIKRGTMANYEIGRNEPIDAVVSIICREFNVSEKWLRTGEGEMFVQEPIFNLEDYAKQRGVSDLEREILKLDLDLDADIRKKLIQHFKERFVPQKSTADADDGKEPS